jgi:phosphatidylinositol glycan class S
MLTDQDLDTVGQVLLSQMRQVIAGAHFDKVMTVADRGGGLSDWELETLKRRHLHYFMHSAVNSLESLQKLVSDITNIVVLDSIQQLFETAVDGIVNAKQSVNIDAALQSAKKSYLASESAFFDAKMLGLLYFPDEHKYAIYALPFFPIVYQLLTGAYKEIKHQRKSS